MLRCSLATPSSGSLGSITSGSAKLRYQEANHVQQRSLLYRHTLLSPKRLISILLSMYRYMELSHDGILQRKTKSERTLTSGHIDAKDITSIERLLQGLTLCCSGMYAYSRLLCLARYINSILTILQRKRQRSTPNDLPSCSSTKSDDNGPGLSELENN